MKLTKSEIKQKQEDLVKVLLQLKRLGESKKSLTAALADDFEANEEKYRNGIVTAGLDKGVIRLLPKLGGRQLREGGKDHLRRTALSVEDELDKGLGKGICLTGSGTRIDIVYVSHNALSLRM